MLAVTSGRRPSKPAIAQSLHQSCFDDLWVLINQCWGSTLEDRLPMDSALAGLEKLLLVSSSASSSALFSRTGNDMPAVVTDIATTPFSNVGEVTGEFII